MKSNGNGLRLYAILYLAFLYAPIILLPLFAFNDGTIIAFPLKGFSTKWFEAMAEDGVLKGAVINSLIVGSCTAILSTTLALLAARASTRFEFKGKGGIMGLIMMPLILPEIVMAMAILVVILQVFGDVLGLPTIILGHTLICTPFAIAILSAAFQSLDKSLEEAAYDLGENKWSTFRLIILPLVLPGIISALLISFTISMDEFILANFLGGTEPTLPVYIYSQLRFPKAIPVIMAVATCLVAVSISLLIIAEYFRRRGVAKTGGKDSGGFL
jgi:spermidine/putrescine transport system permease protein